MPTLTFAGGKLMLVYYDLRETRAQTFGQFVDDGRRGRRRQAAHDRHLRASMASPGDRAGVRSRRFACPTTSMGSAARNGGPDRAAAGQSAEPADVQAGHRAVHRRLHRRHRGAGVRADAKGRWIYNTAAIADAAGLPRGVDRQPRRARAASTPTATAIRGTTTRRPDAAGRPAEPGRSDARPSGVRAGPATPGRATRTSTPRASPAACSSARRATPSRCRRRCSAASWCSRRTTTAHTKTLPH